MLVLKKQAKRSISASIRGTLQRAPLTTPCTASLSELQHIMSLAPPYIPRSIRQVDQSTTEANMSELPPNASALANNDTRFRVQDVNSWLNSIQQNHLNSSTNNHHPIEEIAQPSNSIEQQLQLQDQDQQNQMLILASEQMGSGNGNGESNSERRNNQNELYEEINQVDDLSTIPRSLDDQMSTNQESKSDRSPRVTIEYSSSPLPIEILNGGDSHIIDGPIVLGGDRVSVGSRPNSARPMSAKKSIVSL